MANKNPKKAPITDSVDQIRNILFGEQITVIESRFEQLENNLTQAISDLSDKLNEANKELANQISLSNKQLQSESNSLAQENTESIKSLEKSLNNKIIETESELINQIQTGLQKLDEKASHRNELAKLLKEMADKLAD